MTRAPDCAGPRSDLHVAVVEMTKRRRAEEEEADDLVVPSETELHIDLFLNLLGPDPTVPRLVFLHQLYALVPNRTLVDKELAEMRLSRAIRVIHTPLGQAVMKSEHFYAGLSKVGPDNLGTRFQGWLEGADKISVSLGDLAFTIAEADILVAHGWLSCRRDVAVEQVFWIAHPGTSRLVNNVQSVRKAVQGIVTRTRYKEISADELMKKSWGGLPLLAHRKYYIYDCVGCDKLTPVRTAAGSTFYRIQKV